MKTLTKNYSVYGHKGYEKSKLRFICSHKIEQDAIDWIKERLEFLHNPEDYWDDGLEEYTNFVILLTYSFE